ncbi:MAG: DUF3300 domain-containing protein [Verrucomicrobia bacterium]|nr:DUF3300 domain-containing protein [Verrucomicrobiota bacterium]
MNQTTLLTSALIVLVSAATQAPAQWAVPPPAPAVEMRSPVELDQLLAPIALYPDPLIAQILPAATQPGEIVLAARYCFGGGDPNQIDLQPWSLSVKAVARYPEVLKMMDQRLDWTAQLGQAFLYQQGDVMDAIQRLRAQAQMLGNLRTTPQQYVVADSGVIEILPASPEMIYVPVYQPDFVYAQSGFFLSFGIGLSIGLWLNHDCDWHHRDVIVWGRDSHRPHDWWRRSPRDRHMPAAVNNRVSYGDRNLSIWRPHSRTPITTMNRADRGWDTRNAHPGSGAGSQPGGRSSGSRDTRSVTSQPGHQTTPTIHRTTPGTTIQPAGRPSGSRDTRSVTSEPGHQATPTIHRTTPTTVQRPAPAVQQTAPAPTVRSSGGSYTGSRSTPDTRRVTPEPSRQTTPTVQRTAPTIQRTSPAPSVRSYSGSNVGSQTARDARAASSRGQQSRETISRPPPPTRSAPSQAAPPSSSRGSDSSNRRQR